MAPARWLLLLSSTLLALRILAATRVGFGDAEALYVAYGLHPQPVYLDHPGLVGLVARALGGGGAPSPLRLHLATALAATLVPWVGVLAARCLGATARSAPLAGLALLAAPEITVGLFALTPDLLLAPLWLLAAGAWGRALRRHDEGARALSWFLLAGCCAGLAAAAKVSGFLLLGAMFLSIFDPHRPPRRRAPGPWIGLVCGALLSAPVLWGEVAMGFPMLTHRLVSTQREAGFSLRNVGAFLGGQLGYLSPLVAAAALLLGRWLVRQGRGLGAGPRWLLALLLVSGPPLALLCLWSRVAEPHWAAPAWLALALAFALPEADAVVAPWLRRWALGSGVALSLLVHGWTLTELAPRHLGGAYEGRYDLANDLLLWAELAPRVAAARDQLRVAHGVEPVILAPHWIVAAQAAATGAGGRVSTVACLAGSRGIPDDFCRWEPAAAWGSAPLLWVSDDRFPLDPPALEGRIRGPVEWIELQRGGRVVRRAALLPLLSP